MATRLNSPRDRKRGVTITDIVNLYSTDSETRNCSAAPLSYPHCHKAGKTIFENVFGMPMLDHQKIC